jgi:hypothetical protein
MTAKKNTIKVGETDLAIDPAEMYRVTLAGPVRAGGIWYRPSNRNSQLRGDLLAQAAKEHPGAVLGFEAIEAVADV